MVEPLGLLLFPPHALLRDHPKPRAFEPRDDQPGDVAFGRIGLNDRKRTFSGHSPKSPLGCLESRGLIAAADDSGKAASSVKQGSIIRKIWQTALVWTGVTSRHLLPT